MLTFLSLITRISDGHRVGGIYKYLWEIGHKGRDCCVPCPSPTLPLRRGRRTFKSRDSEDPIRGSALHSTGLSEHMTRAGPITAARLHALCGDPSRGGHLIQAGQLVFFPIVMRIQTCRYWGHIPHRLQ